MRWLLLLLVAVLVAADIFNLDLSLGPGLSVKNAVLYLIAAGLFFRLVMGGGMQIEMPAVQGYFALWIGYAVLTSFVAALIIRYPGYHLSGAAISLKTLLIDPMVFFLTVFYGLRNRKDVSFFLKGLVAALCISSVLTLADVAGIVHITLAVGEEGIEAGRVYGFFGHANETGSLIACMLPVMLAVAASGRTAATRVLWYAGAFASALVLIMTVSRGAFVAAFAAAIGGAYLCRKYIRVNQFLLWGFGVVALVVIVGVTASVIDPQTSSELYKRLIGQSSTIDMGEFTSGRSSIWATTITTMMDSPLSMLTGFGWNVYETMPFMLATHNYYLDLWFDLGLLGVAMFVLIVRRCMMTVQQALSHSSGEQQRYLLAFQFGMIALLVAVFFTLIFRPWPYIWMYIGAMLRAAVIAQSAPQLGSERAEPVLRAAAGLRARDRHVPAGIH